MINWREIIFDLQKAGLKNVQIAERLGIPASTISGLKNEMWNEPRYSTGCKILALRKLCCKNAVGDVYDTVDRDYKNLKELA